MYRLMPLDRRFAKYLEREGSLAASESPTLENEETNRQMQEVLSVLPSFERDIVELRYGFNGEGPYPLDVVAGKLGCPREMVRTHEVKALRILKAVVTENPDIYPIPVLDIA